MKQPEQVHEIALEEAPAAQIGEFATGKAKRAKRADFALDFTQIRREVHTRRAALETVFDLGTRKVMQYHLHHGELVEIGVEQRLDDHARTSEGGTGAK